MLSIGVAFVSWTIDVVCQAGHPEPENAEAISPLEKLKCGKLRLVTHTGHVVDSLLPLYQN